MGFGDVNVRLDFDTERIMAKIEESRREADFALGNQVLKDSNIYCKEDTGTLKRSAIVNSSDDLTTVQWVEPYAATQYELPAAVPDPNPLASSKWFEKAKDAYLPDWISTYERNMKG
ncbi:MAG: minor capsid protein [Oscillospiraceae bacterium]